MEKKKCNKCGEVKDISEFHKDKDAIDGVKSRCKVCLKKDYQKGKATFEKLQNERDYVPITEKKCCKCGKIKNISEFHKNKYNYDGLQAQCNVCRAEAYHTSDKTSKREYDADRYQNDKENRGVLRRKHYSDNKEDYALYNKQYYEHNKESCNIRSRQYGLDNKEKISEIGKRYRESNAKYELFIDKLTIDELPRLHRDGIFLEVKCRYCDKYFIPSYRDATSRACALDGRMPGENYLYCSEECKQACPVYRRVKYPKDFKRVIENSGHEGNVIWRQEVIKRNIEEHGQLQCEICGNTNEDELSVHHEKPQKTHPEMALDPDNGWVLCAFGKGNNCHLKYGHPKGTNCSMAELAKLVCVEKPRRITKNAD